MCHLPVFNIQLEGLVASQLFQVSAFFESITMTKCVLYPIHIIASYIKSKFETYIQLAFSLLSVSRRAHQLFFSEHQSGFKKNVLQQPLSPS